MLREEEDRLAQASGTVNSSYNIAIPFRQLEFKNAFIEQVVCDKIKNRKATSQQLRQCFKIANKHTIVAIPTAPSTLATQITAMFYYFEPKVIKEIQNAKS